jgi:glycosyltransferase involved in cell wall biosynthesis
MSTRGRLCFYVPYLYPVAVRADTELAGGIEVQHWAVARGLARRGFDVRVATGDYGQDPVVVREGVSLVRTYSTIAGIPGIRFFYPRLWKAMRTLIRARADVYVASGAGLHAGWGYDASRLAGGRFVFFAASDKDAVAALPALARRRERWWYLRALRGADARVAQTEFQRSLLQENFGLDAEVISNPVEIPETVADAGANDVVLWLSTYKPSKRPEWFLELARRLPEIRFVMAGYPPAAATNGSWQEANAAMLRQPNLEVLGFVEHPHVGRFFAEAALFVHTSPLEGFPNTLLEAWSHGIPTVSAVDPGGVIQRHQIGELVESSDSLVKTVETLMRAPDLRRATGARARRYVEEHHGPERTVEPIADLFDRVIREARRK